MFYVLRIMSGKRRGPGTKSDERSRKRDVHNMRQKIPSGDIFFKLFFEDAKKMKNTMCFYYFQKILFFRKIKVKTKMKNSAHSVPVFIGLR